MTYIFDSGPLIFMFKSYYPNRFPTLWERFDELVSSETIISVREVARELAGHEDLLATWVSNHKVFFQEPTRDEMLFIRKIFATPHYQGLIRKQERLKGKPVADPFIIAKAHCIADGCVVTTEKHKKNASQIPNICEHFEIPWKNLEQFMETEKWRF